MDAYAEIGAGADGVVLSASREILKGCCAGCAVHAGAFKAPVLLFHGDRDQNVGVDESRLMRARLSAAGKAVQFVSLPGEDHWLSRSETRQKTLTEMVRFIEANNPADPAPVAAVSQ